MKSNRVLAAMAALFLAFCVVASADDRPDKGKIVSIDSSMQSMVIQGEEGDQWTVYWTETTRLGDELTMTELKPGDSVHFNYVEKDGKMWVTELHRTDKAD